MNLDAQYRMLVESLELVAADAEVQLAALPAFVCATDEVVTTYTDALLLLPQLQRAEFVPTTAVEALARLDTILAALPVTEDVLARSGLRAHPVWEEARCLARLALDSLGEVRRGPALDQHAWIGLPPNGD